MATREESREVRDPRASDLDEAIGRARVLEHLFGVTDVAPSVGRFVLLERVGQGAMGTVWAAYDPVLDRRVAVKLLHRSEGDGEDERVLREARMLASVNHPNVVHVYEVGTRDGHIFIAMEFVEGPTLRAWLRERERAWDRVVTIFVQAARGLAAAHDRGVVHRDFKPDNVLVGADGRARVADFGLAIAGQTTTDPGDAPSGEDRGSAGSTRGRAGTPEYMAPEQLRGDRLDERADQFAFCVALFEALAGVRPFDGLARGRASLQRLPTRVPRWLRSCLARGLEIDPANRFGSMRALIHALDRRPGRMRGVFVGTGVAGLVTAAAFLGRSTAGPDEPCPDAHAQLVGAWDDERRAAVQTALDEAAPAWSAATWATVEARLDDYADAWASARQDACEATHVRREQSTELFDARMACLADRRRALRALVDTLASADATVAERAVNAVEAVPAIEACADAESVRAAHAVPDDPELAARVVEERDALADARALSVAGRHEEALTLARAAFERASKLEYRPLTADAAQVLGASLSARGRIDEAEAHLREAYGGARRSRQDEVAVAAASDLAYLLARFTPRYDDAMTWADVATLEGELLGSAQMQAAGRNAYGIAAARSGANEQARAAFEKAIAWMEPLGPTASVVSYRANLARQARGEGKIEEAAQMLERVLRDAEALVGTEHPLLLSSLEARAEVLVILERAGEAKPLLLRALDIAMRARGPEHPDTARILSVLGRCAMRMNDLEAAHEYLRRAVEAGEAAHRNGSETGIVGLDGLAEVQLLRGEPEQAVETLRRNVAEQERAAPGGRDAGVAHGRLAQVLLASERSAEALVEADAALAILERALGPEHLDLSEGLHVRAEALAALGRADEAAKDLERALKIRAAAFDPSSPKHADLLVAFAEVRLQQARSADALVLAERAYALVADVWPGPELAALQFVLARALYETAPERALELATTAAAAYRAGPVGLQRRVHAIEAWMKARGS